MEYHYYFLTKEVGTLNLNLYEYWYLVKGNGISLLLPYKGNRQFWWILSITNYSHLKSHHTYLKNIHPNIFRFNNIIL